MKRYILLWVIGLLLTSVVACNDSPYNDENKVDTLTVLPADTATPAVLPREGDTAIPRVDPALDSAARQMDDAIPPK